MKVITSKVPNRPGETTPLEPGVRLPPLELLTVERQPFDPAAAALETPQIMVYFRGTWCPQGEAQMLELRDVQARIEALGYHLAGVCPDRPHVIAEWTRKHRIGFPVLSDPDMSAAIALGIAWRPDPADIAEYRAQGIDVQTASGGEPLLSIPGIFFVHSDGRVGFVFAHPDHTMRMPAEVLLAIARATTET